MGVRVTTLAGYAVKADPIQVKNGGLIQGSAFCNDLSNNGGNPGLTCGAVSLPVFAEPPTFVTRALRPARPNVSVAKNGSATLAPCDDGPSSVTQGGVVTFTGGIYNLAEIDSGPSTTLRFQTPSEIRIAGKFGLDHVCLRRPRLPARSSPPPTSSSTSPGSTATTVPSGSTPRAVKIGTTSTAQANFYAPNGTIQMQQGAQATGAFLARDVQGGLNVDITLASFFSNRAPTAQPQDLGQHQRRGRLTITLNASDPENDDLTFSIVTGPSQGTLGAVMQDPPPRPVTRRVYPGQRPRPREPPRTSATVETRRLRATTSKTASSSG